MYKLIAPALLAMFASSHAAAGSTPGDKPLTPQQQKMRDCNAEAKEQALKGDERKVFMKECLRNDGAAIAGKPTKAAKTASSQ